jgi:hypothetical protein
MQERAASNSKFRTLRSIAIEAGMTEMEADLKLEGIRQLLISLRKLHRMSRARWAKRAKVPVYAIECYERGNDEISESAFDRMCVALGVGVRFHDNEHPEMPEDFRKVSRQTEEIRFGVVPDGPCPQCAIERASYN